MKNAKNSPKRNKAQSEQDFSDVARLMLEGNTQRQIAEWIGRNRPYELSPAMVNRIAQEAVRQWRADGAKNIGELKARDLARLADIERRASEAYERSLKPRVTTRTGDGKTITITEKRDGDPRWLEVILNCIRQRREICGYSAPKSLHIAGDDGGPVKIGLDVMAALEMVYGDDRPQAPEWSIGLQAPRPV